MAITAKDAAGATFTVETDYDSGTGVHTTKTNIGTTSTSAADAASLPAKGQLIAADNGSAAKFVQSDADGNLKVVPSSGSEFQVDLVSIGGAATAALQTSSEALLTSIDGDTSTLAGAVNSSKVDVNIASDAASLATSTLQGTINTSIGSGNALLGTIDADTSALAACASGSELQVDVVSIAGLPSTVNHGTYALPGTGTAYQLNSGSVAVTEIVQIKAGSGNSGTTYIGGSGVTTGNGYPLAAGDTLSLPVANVNVVYCIGTSSDTVSWIAT